MADAAAHKRFVGNLCLYRGLALRKPRPFLQRNIHTVLDRHAERLASSADDDEPYEAMFSGERTAAGWQYPTEAMLMDLVNGDKPTLKIDALQLRLMEERGDKCWRKLQSSHESDGLDWLPLPSESLRLPCRVSICIRDASNSVNVGKLIYGHSQEATIVRRQSNDTSHYFDITLEQAFLIKVDKLFILKEAGTNGSRHWKRTVLAQYTMEVAILCENVDDNAELLGMIESETSEPSGFDRALANESVLRAIYPDLPQCPPEGSLLQLRRDKSDSSHELKYGMDLSMGWSKRIGSPLQRHNRTRLRRGRQLLTPSVSDHQETAPDSPYTIQYSYREGMLTRVYTQNDLNCVWCQSMAEEKRGSGGWYDRLALPCKSLDRLRFHYKTCHDHFRFEVGDVVKEDSKLLVTISFGLTDRCSSFAASEKPAKEDYSWLAPARPFDLSRYVAGDENWTGGFKAKSKRGPGKLSRSREDTEGAATTPHMVVARGERPALNEIEGLPAPRRKKYKVPVVDGVIFYHNLSKQRIKAGEELSESDDEIYDDRLAQSQRRDFSKLGLSNFESDFHHQFNRHLDAEQSGSATFFREAIVRFARVHQSKLHDDGWRHAFKKKLRHLKAHGIISTDVMVSCLDSQSSVTRQRTNGAWSAERIESMEGEDELQDIIKDTLQTSGTRDENGQNAAAYKKPLQSGSAGRYRYVNGHFVQRGDDDKSITGSASPGVERPIGNRHHEKPSIAHRVIEYTWSGALQQAKSSTAYAFLKDGLQKSADDVVLRDLDFAKFIETLKRELAYDSSWTEVVCRRGEVDISIKDSVQWQAALKTWEKVEDLRPLLFVIKRIQSPTATKNLKLSEGDTLQLRVKKTRKWAGVGSDLETIQQGFDLAKRKPTAPLKARTLLTSGMHVRESMQPPARKTTKRTCICNKSAEGGLGCIACDDPACERRNFHMTCVGVTDRTLGWKCATCAIL